jgi:hypothetical protein
MKLTSKEKWSLGAIIATFLLLVSYLLDLGPTVKFLQFVGACIVILLPVILAIAFPLFGKQRREKKSFKKVADPKTESKPNSGNPPSNQPFKQVGSPNDRNNQGSGNTPGGYQGRN